MDTDIVKGTEVALGRHVVPQGIAVEEFIDDGSGDLKSSCPDGVSELLEGKDLLPMYEKLIKELVSKGLTSSFSGTWTVPKLVEVVQELRPFFQEKGVRIALCLLHSNCGNFRWMWLEFIDNCVTSMDYKPEFDVSYHKVVLNGNYMVPPKGVTIMSLDDIYKSECPEDLKEFLDVKGLSLTYEELKKNILGSRSSSFGSKCKTNEVNDVVKEFREKFQRQGVEILVGMRSTDAMGWSSVKWLEFIDTKVANEYVPQYDVDEQHKAALAARCAPRSSSHLTMKADIPREKLMTDGVVTLSEECPPDVQELLEQKDLLSVYNLLDQAVGRAQGLANFLDIWRLAEQGIISYPSIAVLKSTFMDKGVKIVLCETIGKSGNTYWLEYVDMEQYADYMSPYDTTFEDGGQLLKYSQDEEVKGYSVVLGGRHFVPEGVFVEELRSTKKLTAQCPEDVEHLLIAKGLKVTYDNFLDKVVSSDSTRTWSGSWRSKEIISVLDDFQKEFNSRGLKVALCKLKPDTGESFRSFEFIDLEVAGTYVPQYDVSSFSEDTIELYLTKLEFPKGVAVELLMNKKNVIEAIPPPVKSLMEKKGCMQLYHAFEEILCSSGVFEAATEDAAWSKDKMRQISKVLGPKFEAKGVSVFLSAMVEDAISEEKTFYWVEYVDRAQQPNYKAQRGIDMQKIPPGAMSKKEIAIIAGIVTASVALEVAMHLM